MRKQFVFFPVAATLLVTVLFIFLSAYKVLTEYAELSKRRNQVRAHFQSLSVLVSNATVINPVLVAANNSDVTQLFPTDSAGVIKELHQLCDIVRDSVNISITQQLKPELEREISWILASNVPDSIISGSSTAHIASLQKIQSLLRQGVNRTTFLVDYQQVLLDREINKVRIGIILFIVLTGGLLSYTTFGLFSQQSKRRLKEWELETIFNRINDAVISIDNDWRYTFLNDAALANHPLGRAKTIGKKLWEVHPEVKGTIFEEKFKEAILTKAVTHAEAYYEPFQTWFAARAYPSDNGLTIFYQDVSERKKTEQKASLAIKELADYKYALDESSIVAITDQKGRILHANDNFCRISKYALEELIGQDHRIINSGYHSKDFIKDLWRTIAGGKIWKGELRNKAKDGTIYWVDTTIVPFVDEQGKPYQYVAIRSDITGRKEAEQRIIQSEKIYRTIASSIPGSAISLLDREYRFLLVEGDLVESLKLSKGDMAGRRADEIVDARRYQELVPDWQRAFAGETVVHEINRETYDVILKIIPIREEDGTILKVMNVAIDITALKEAQRGIIELNRGLEEKVMQRTAQLKRANEELEAFSYSVSHDLRAPLRGIIGFIAILEEEYGTVFDKEGRRLLSVISRNATGMGKLIDDLLSFFRTSQQPLVKTRIDSEELVDKVIAELMQRRPAGSAPVTWQRTLLPPVNADLNTIKQVWLNLLSNALKYSSNCPAPVITIGSFNKEMEHVFFVRDNGVGFDQAYADKLFRVFQRLHSNEEFEGTGVGLALVGKIISRHGGTVRADGKPGGGACFFFSLPY